MKTTKILTDIFSIYWKKNLLFIPFFISFDFLPVHYPNVSCFGFPFKYYCEASLFTGQSYFSILIFIVDILFWYAVTGLIVKRSAKISRSVTKLNYATLGIALLMLFIYSTNLILKSNVMLF